MFKSIADIKKAMVVGSSWHCLHHGTTSQPTKKDMGTRKVTVVQSNSFAFESLNNPGSNSWCDWPKKANVIFHEGDSFTITESGRPRLTYTKVNPAKYPDYFKQEVEKEFKRLKRTATPATKPVNRNL